MKLERFFYLGKHFDVGMTIVQALIVLAEVV